MSINNFYIARKNLKLSANFDLFCSAMWSLFILVISIYHFGYLRPGADSGSYSHLSSSENSGGVTVSYPSTYVATYGYSGFFNAVLIDFSVFKITVWTVVLVLFILILISFIFKVCLGSFSAYYFFKFKDGRCLYAALAVVFFPLVGGIIATNTYLAKTGHIHPKYVASYSFIRGRVRNGIMNMSKTSNAN